MWRQAGTTGAVGIEIAAAIAIGYFGGQFLDRKFATTPWLTYAGFAVGLGASVKALVRVVRDYNRMNRTQDEQEKSGKPDHDSPR